MKGYVVLTKEKIEDIFDEIKIKIYDLVLLSDDFFCIQVLLESKKQELLKSIKQNMSNLENYMLI